MASRMKSSQHPVNEQEKCRATSSCKSFAWYNPKATRGGGGGWAELVTKTLSPRPVSKETTICVGPASDTAFCSHVRLFVELKPVKIKLNLANRTWWQSAANKRWHSGFRIMSSIISSKIVSALFYKFAHHRCSCSSLFITMVGQLLP